MAISTASGSCKRLRRLAGSLLLACAIFSSPAWSASAGLPFTEDFSGEELKDEALTNADWSTTNMAVYMRWVEQSWSATGTNITNDEYKSKNLQLGDMNGDGFLDVVVVNTFAANRIYLNDGKGGFLAGSDMSGHENESLDLALGDVDGDGDLDVAVANASFATPDIVIPFVGTIPGIKYSLNRLYLNNGDGTFTSSELGPDDAQVSQAIEMGDVDNDGDLDIVAGNLLAKNRLYINDGHGNFPASGIKVGTLLGPTLDIELADVNGDGYLDLVEGNDVFHNRLFLNLGSGDFSSDGSNIGNQIDPTYSIELNDVDSDGDLDVVSGNFLIPNRLYKNDGNGNFDSGSELGSEWDFTSDLEFGDIDGDGDDDLIVGNYTLQTGFSFTYQENRMYLNDGDGNFSTSGTLVGSEKDGSYAVDVGDVDLDGDLDVVSGNTRLALIVKGQPNRVYYNDLKRGTVVSAQVNTGEEVGFAVLYAEDTQPANTSIDYFLSNDGGGSWHQVVPGETFTFPSAGTDLRWKAQMYSLSPDSTPEIGEIQVLKNHVLSGGVSIEGDAIENAVLTAVNDLEDEDGIGDLVYQWMRNDEAIDGANSSTYVPVDADVGALVSVHLSYVDGGGTLEAVESGYVGPVTNVNDDPEGDVSIAGDAVEDATLLAVPSIADEDGLGELSYQWQRDGQDIEGATSDSLLLGDDDVGAMISVTVSYTDGFGTEEAVASEAVGPVENVNDEPAGSVTIAGSALVGNSLIATFNIQDNDGNGVMTLQWLLNGQVVPGESGPTLTLVDAYEGGNIQLVATYTDGQGTVESMASNVIGPVVSDATGGDGGDSNDGGNGSGGSGSGPGDGGDGGSGGDEGDTGTNWPVMVTEISVTQRGLQVEEIALNAGAIHVSVAVFDPNPEDVITIRWFLNGEYVPEYDDKSEGVIPSSELELGGYEITMQVTSSGHPDSPVEISRSYWVVAANAGQDVVQDEEEEDSLVASFDLLMLGIFALALLRLPVRRKVVVA